MANFNVQHIVSFLVGSLFQIKQNGKNYARH